MAKKVKRPKKKKPMDSAGWGFFAITSLILLAPGMYVGWLMQSSIATPGAPLLFGMLATFIVAGFVTWVANVILQGMARRRRRAKETKE